MFIKTALLAAVAALGAVSAANAAPVPSSDLPAMTVSLAGLDLHNEAGAKAAYHRIRLAAQDVCLAEKDARPVWVDPGQPSCMTLTADRAIAALGSPTVSALNGHRASGAQFAASGR